MQKNIVILILLFLSGCKETGKKAVSSALKGTTNIPVKISHSSMQASTVSKAKLEKEKFAEQQQADSINLLKILGRALRFAGRNKLKDSFHHKVETITDDGSYKMTAQLDYGHLFAKDRKHLIVRRNVPWGIICDVFLLEGGHFENVCNREQLGMTYIDNMVRDVNGDGFKDFSVHWYPSSGCCARNVYDVFLYNPKSGSFTQGYKFINPTFFPQEKIIRGVEYGHPGEVGLYKYRWNGIRVNTIEFIYPYMNPNGKFIRTRTRHYKTKQSDGVVLKALPKEYRRIESVEWFLDY